MKWRLPALPSSPPRVLVITTGNSAVFENVEIQSGEKLRLSFGPGLKKISEDGLDIIVTLETSKEKIVLLEEHIPPYDNQKTWTVSDWLALPTGKANIVISCGPGPQNIGSADWLALSELFICKPADYPLWTARQNKVLRTKNEIAHFSRAYRLPMFTTKRKRNASAWATKIIQSGSVDKIVNFHERARLLSKERSLDVLTICCGGMLQRLQYSQMLSTPLI